MQTHDELEHIATQLHVALEERDWNTALAILESLRSPDRADLIADLAEADQAALLPRLSPADAADILEQLDAEQAASLTTALPPATATQIIDEMEPDKAADLLERIPPEQAQFILAGLEDPDEVRPLLLHARDTAGGLMTSEFLALRRRMTAAEAIEAIRQWKPDAQAVYYLFVVDRFGKLCGVVNLRRLIVAEPETQIAEIMDPDVISVLAGTDQEECARLMSRYDFMALPVVDSDNTLLGIITIDDVIDVAQQEATEDFQLISGVAPVEINYARAGVSLLWRKRVGWLLVLLLADFMSSSVIAHFEKAIEAVVALAFFIPILIDSGGNTGTQSATLVIRGLATGQLSVKDWARVAWKEVRVGLLLGITLAAIVYARSYFWRGGPEVGLVVALTMICLLYTSPSPRDS